MDRIYRNILSNQWRFAKTMPNEPHWYTLRKDWDDEEFVYFVEYIRRHGYASVYNGRKYIKLNINGYMYWTMGAAINKPDGSPYTILINRALINYETNYDKISENYDTLFNDEESVKEDKELLALLDIKGSVLDVGCGTGLLLDYMKVEKYIGTDVSNGMLNVFRDKHPEVELYNTTVKDFFTYEKFDTILGLYGVGSYMTNAEFKKLEKLLSAGGKIYIMSFKEGYSPVTYQKTGISETHTVNNPDLLSVEFHNFIIYTNDEKLLQKH